MGRLCTLIQVRKLQLVGLCLGLEASGVLSFSQSSDGPMIGTAAAMMGVIWRRCLQHFAIPHLIAHLGTIACRTPAACLV